MSCSAEYPQRLVVKLHLTKEWPEPRGIAVILAEVLPAAFPLLITQRYAVCALRLLDTCKLQQVKKGV